MRFRASSGGIERALVRWARGGAGIGALLLLALPVRAEPGAASIEPAAVVPASTAETAPPNYVRPALEMGLGLGAAAIWYWIDGRNVFDWDRPSLEQRLNGEAWRFDNNAFSLNFFWHPLAGAGLYALARGNRLSVPVSFLYSLTGSTLWEYVIEFKEKVSINDMLITPLTGIPLGEFAHKLAEYLSSVPPESATQHALVWTLGLSVYGHRSLDGIEPPPYNRVDRLGYASPLFRRFSFYYGFGQDAYFGSPASAVHVLGARGKLVSLPGYRTVGSFGAWFHSAEITELEIEIDAGKRGVGGDLFSEAIVGGYHAQIIGARGPRPGGAFATTGVAVAYRYRSDATFGFDDRQGFLHAPGLAIDLGAERDGRHARLALRSYLSFGGMSNTTRSAAAWRVRQGRTKTVLERWGYTFGYAFTGMAEASLGIGLVELRARLGYTSYRSIQGLDRTQENVERDPLITEIARDSELSAWFGPPELPLALGLDFESRRRRSGVAGSSDESGVTRVGGERLLMKVELNP